MTNKYSIDDLPEKTREQLRRMGATEEEILDAIRYVKEQLPNLEQFLKQIKETIEKQTGQEVIVLPQKEAPFDFRLVHGVKPPIVFVYPGVKVYQKRFEDGLNGVIKSILRDKKGA